MKTVCAWLNKLIGCSVLVGLLLPTAIDADVLPITAVTVAEHPTLGTGEVLTDLTFDGVTWRQLVGGTASNITGGGVRFYSSDENTSDFGALLTGLSTTTGVANVSSIDITFDSQVFQPGDGSCFFMFEIYGNDSVSVQPLDGSGSVIADYSLTLSGSQYGVAVNPTDAVLRSYGGEETGFTISGLTFDLSDFTYTGSGTDPGMPDVYGLRFADADGSVTWDPAVFGSARVPEPSTALLLCATIGILGLGARRRG